MPEDWGGIENLQFLRDHASPFSKNTLPGKTLDLTVGCVADESFNAWAASNAGKDYIGINYSVLPILADTFRAILTREFVFNEITENFSEKAFYLDVKPHEMASASILGQIPKLNDAARENLVGVLAHGAHLYVMFHELAHIYNGHTLWISNAMRQNSITEVGPPPASSELSLIRQTLEFDADCWAANRLMQSVWNPLVDYTTIPNKWTVGKRSMGLRAGLEHIATILRIVHIYFAEKEYNIGNNMRNHPPAAVRETYLTGLIQTVLRVRLGLEGDDVDYHIFGYSNNAAKAFYDILGRQIPNEYYGDSDQIIYSYRDCWNNIKSEVEKYRRGGSPFTAQNDG